MQPMTISIKGDDKPNPVVHLRLPAGKGPNRHSKAGG
jgi:hypothetical protein